MKQNKVPMFWFIKKIRALFGTIIIIIIIIIIIVITTNSPIVL